MVFLRFQETRCKSQGSNQESRTKPNPTAGGLGSRLFQGSCLEPEFHVSEKHKCSSDKTESWQFTLILDQFAADQFTWMRNSSGSIHIDVGAALGPTHLQAHSGVAVSSPSHRSHVRDPTAEQQLPEPQPGFAQTLAQQQSLCQRLLNGKGFAWLFGLLPQVTATCDRCKACRCVR